MWEKKITHTQNNKILRHLIQLYNEYIIKVMFIEPYNKHSKNISKESEEKAPNF